MFSQMTVSETRATMDVRMSMEKYSFQTMTAQTDKVVRPPQTPKILDTSEGGGMLKLKDKVDSILYIKSDST